MMQIKIKIFLASSSELEEDRKEFEILINRKNKDCTAGDCTAEIERARWQGVWVPAHCQ